MDIVPLAFNQKTDPEKELKKFKYEDVYQKNQQLRQLAKQRGQRRPRFTSTNGSICEHHSTMDQRGLHLCGQQQSQPTSQKTFHKGGGQKIKILKSSVLGECNDAQQAQTYPIGFHVIDSGGVTNEYSHFQNQTLKELADSRTISLDRNDRCYSEERSPECQGEEQQSTRQTILSRRDINSTRTINQPETYSSIQRKVSVGNEKRSYIQAELIGSLKSGYGFLPNYSVPNNQGSRTKRPFDGSQSNRQSRNETSGGAQTLNSEIRTKARSPGTKQISMQLSPLGRRRMESQTNRRPTSTDLPMPDQSNQQTQAAMKADSNNCCYASNKSAKNGASQTDHASNSSPHEFPQEHKYSNEFVAEDQQSQRSMPPVQNTDEGDDQVSQSRDPLINTVAQQKASRANSSPHTRRAQRYGGMVLQQDKSAQKRSENRQSSKVDFTSLTLYDRYNKLVNLRVQNRNIDGGVIQTMPDSTTGKSPMSFGSSKSRGRRRRNQSSVSPGQQAQTGNEKNKKHITIVVFKDNQKGIRNAKSVDRDGKKTTSVSGGIKKINSRGVPIRKPDGRLKNLRIANSPETGLVQLNFPMSRQSTLQRSDCNKEVQTPKPQGGPEVMIQDAGKQTQTSNKRKTEPDEPQTNRAEANTQFEIIKSVEQMQILSFTDNVSEGTNRISASHIKVKQQSKLSTGAPNSGDMIVPNSEEAKDSHVTFKQGQQRRSIEFAARTSGDIGSQIRNQTKSKSIDSGEATSNIHYMLKPKGIEVFSQSIGTSADIGTPKNANANIFTQGKRLSDIAEFKERGQHQSAAQLSSAIARDVDAVQISQTEKKFEMTFDKRVEMPPIISQDNIKSDQVVTAKLQSSISDQGAASLIQENKSPEAKKSSTKLEMLDLNEGSEASLISSIKTSIDDETLMELAKKGISAMTPVNAKKQAKHISALRLSNTQDNLKMEEEKLTFAKMALPEVRLSGKTQQTNSGSQITENHHLQSTLQESTAEVHQNLSRADGLSSKARITKTDENDVINKASEKGTIASQFSERKVILNQMSRHTSPVKMLSNNNVIPNYTQANIQISDLSKKVVEKQPPKDITMIKVTPLESPKNGGGSTTNKTGGAEEKKIAENNLTFSSKIQQRGGLTYDLKLQQKTEIEAMSQTDFGPLPPLEPGSFSLDEMHGNYDLLIQGEMGADQSILNDFSIAQRIGIKSESILEFPVNKEMSSTSMSKTGIVARQGGPSMFQADGSFIQTQYLEPQSAGVHGSRNLQSALQKGLSGTQTENVLSRLSPGQIDPTHLNSPQGMIKNVTIETQNGTKTLSNGNYQSSMATDYGESLAFASSMIRKGQRGQSTSILDAASRGKRIIYKTMTGLPEVVNLRPEELASSPKQHHLIQLQGQPLKAVKLKERNLINRMNSMKNKTMYGTSRLRLSKDFKALTKNVMAHRVSVEGVDKSIGEETSHSSGSYTRSRRKCYILNIDNTKDETVNLATYKSISPNELAKNSPQPTMEPVVTTIENVGSKDNSMLSKHKIEAQVKEHKSKAAYPTADEIFTDRHLDSSSNERVPGSQDPLSAFGAKCYSRQEDLETVYMQSTMQFNKDLKAGVRLGLTSKSPDPNLIVKDQGTLQQSTFNCNKSNVSVDNNPKQGGGGVGVTEYSAFVPNKDISAKAPASQTQSIERRQIQLKKSQPLDPSKEMQTRSTDEPIMRASYQRRIGNVEFHSKIRSDDANFDDVLRKSAVNQSNQIAIRDELVVQLSNEAQETSNPGSVVKTKKMKKEKDGKGRCLMHSDPHTKENSISSGSLEKLYNPVPGSIKVSMTRQQLVTNIKTDVQKLASEQQLDSRRVRPKTVENSQGRKPRSKTIQTPCSPRDRKMLYLMHKRREVALRRTGMMNPGSAGYRNSIEIEKSIEEKVPEKLQTAKPSFFDKVSEQMSKVFSLDRTSSQVATTVAKNYSQQKTPQEQKIKQSKSQAKPENKKEKRHHIERRMKLHLTINPCSNTSLNQPAKNVISIRANQSQGGQRASLETATLKQRNLTSAFVSSPFSTTAFMMNQADQDGSPHSLGGNFYRMVDFGSQTNDSVGGIINNEAVTQRIQQRVGLKTAEGQSRGRRNKNFHTVDSSGYRNAPGSNPSIDLKVRLKTGQAPSDQAKHLHRFAHLKSQPETSLNDKFKGFDRRYAHEKIFQQQSSNLYQAWNEVASNNTLLDTNQLAIHKIKSMTYGDKLTSETQINISHTKPPRGDPRTKPTTPKRSRRHQGKSVGVKLGNNNRDQRRSPSTVMQESGLEKRTLSSKKISGRLEIKQGNFSLDREATIELDELNKNTHMTFDPLSNSGQPNYRTMMFHTDSMKDYQHNESSLVQDHKKLSPKKQTGVPTNLQSRKEARLLKQGLIYKRNQEMKQQKIVVDQTIGKSDVNKLRQSGGTANNINDLVDSVCHSVYNLDINSDINKQ